MLAGSLWWGPGGSRLRSPLNRVWSRSPARGGLWVAAVVLLLGLAAALGLVAADAGVRWWPDEGQPFRDVSLDRALPRVYPGERRSSDLGSMRRAAPAGTLEP